MNLITQSYQLLDFLELAVYEAGTTRAIGEKTFTEIAIYLSLDGRDGATQLGHVRVLGLVRDHDHRRAAVESDCRALLRHASER